VEAFRPASGDKLWKLEGMTHECIPTPVLGGGMIYVVSGPRGTTYAIRPGGRGEIRGTHVAWSSTKGTPFVPSAILVGDFYYLVDDHGIGTCLAAKTGDLKWRKRLGGNFTASPVSAGGKIYFTNEAGETVVIAGGVPDYRELARNALDEPVYASPAIAHGRLYLRTPSHLVCIAGKSP
jgi:outer membrane protein assembly factor BamB